MIEMTGQDSYREMFSFFEWSAPIYETPEEVIQFLYKADIIGKTVERIRIIGKGRLAKESPLPDDVTMPCEAFFYEPMQLVFGDGSTLEFLPMARGGARIGINSIPKTLNEGANKNNCDAQKLYGQELIGARIGNAPISIQRCVTTKYTGYEMHSEEPDFFWGHEKSVHCSERHHTEFIYSLPFDTGYSLQIWLGNKAPQSCIEYKLSLCYHNKVVVVSKSRCLSAFTEIMQIPLVSGSGISGDVGIVPFDANEKQTLGSMVGQYPNFSLSIDMDQCCAFLGEVLTKYFDVAIQQHGKSEFQEDSYFDWYGVNIYTFDAMQHVVADASHIADLLSSDYENTSLNPVKARYSPSHFGQHGRFTKEEQYEWVHEHIDIAVNFYRRFAYQIQTLIDTARMRGCNAIYITGP